MENLQKKWIEIDEEDILNHLCFFDYYSIELIKFKVK